jgi:hypothetical protein
MISIEVTFDELMRLCRKAAPQLNEEERAQLAAVFHTSPSEADPTSIRWDQRLRRLFEPVRREAGDLEAAALSKLIQSAMREVRHR